MQNEQTFNDFDLEITKLLHNIENIKADIDLYSMIVEEKVLVGV